MECGSLTYRTVYGYPPTHPVNNPVANGQSQTSSFSHGLCGKEGIKYSLNMTLRDTASRIGHIQHYIIAIIMGTNLDCPAIFTYSINGIVNQIEKNLLNL